MSYGTTDQAPQPEQKLLNVRPERAATNEEARPVPWICGKHRLAVTWLDKAINVKTKKVTGTQQAGKNDSQTVTKGIEYRADLLALICIGKIDQLTKVWFNGSDGWHGTINAGSNNAEDFTLSKARGKATIFFGGPSQNPNFGTGHPAYLLQACLRFKEFFFGVDTTAVPSVEVEVGRWPDFDWLPSHKIGDDCNPIAIIADMMTNKLLYGLSESVLDQDQLADTARQLASEGFGLSSAVTRGQRMDQFLTEICSYFDGVPKWVNNKLQIHLQRNAPDRSTLPILNEWNLVDMPDVQSGDWIETYNQTRLTYIRRDNAYKEASTTWSDHGNALLTGSLRVKTLQRPWVATDSLAQKLVSQAGRKSSSPEITGKVQVIERIARNLVCGSFFRLQWTYPEIDLVCKITERRVDRPDSRMVELTWTAEPTQSGDSVDETSPRPEPTPAVPAACPVVRLIELPWPLAPDHAATVAVLASRANGITSQFNLWASLSTANYTNVLTGSDFCTTATLTASVASTATTMQITLNGVDRELDSTSLELASLNTLLLLVGNEWMSISTVNLVGADSYQLTGLLRGRFDTLSQSHAAGDQVIMIVAANIPKSQSFSYALGQSWNFKVQPFASGTALDLATITPITLTLDFTSLRPLTPLNLRATAASGGWTFTWSRTSWDNPGWYQLFASPFTDPDVSHVLEILSGTTVLRTFNIATGTNSQAYTAAQLSADFSSFPASFTARLWSKRTAYRSARYLQLNLTQP